MATETKEVATSKEPITETKETTKVELKLQEAERALVPSWPSQAWGEMARLFEDLFSHQFPAVDIINRENDIVVRAELHGVLKEDLSITISNTSLTIKGKVREEKEEAGEYLRREISRRGTFSRTISLPVEVDSTKGKAKFKDCLLELTLPKAAKLHTMKIE